MLRCNNRLANIRGPPQPDGRRPVGELMVRSEGDYMYSSFYSPTGGYGCTPLMKWRMPAYNHSGAWASSVDRSMRDPGAQFPGYPRAPFFHAGAFLMS